MNRLWVIEWYFDNSKTWEICTSSVNIPNTSTNFYEAHRNKRRIQEILKRDYNKNWYKRCFRVREYSAIETKTTHPLAEMFGINTEWLDKYSKGKNNKNGKRK